MTEQEKAASDAETCPTCHGDGFYFDSDGHGGQSLKKPCRCRLPYSTTEAHVERFRELAVTLKDAATELGTLYGPIHHATTPAGDPAFAERLGRLMKATGVSQEQLAEAIGTRQTAVSYWVTGKREPGMRNLWALADYFGCSIDFLVGRAKADG